MNGVAIWPFAVRINSAGMTIDDCQGSYGRGLCRAIAEGFLRLGTCRIALCMTTVELRGQNNWAVMGNQWTCAEALQVPLPNGVQFMVLGTALVDTVVDLEVTLVSCVQRSVRLTRRFRYPLEEFLTCLSSVVLHLAEALLDRSLSSEEVARLRRWGTDNFEAYLNYLHAWAGAAALRFGVHVSNPSMLLRQANAAADIDPAFQAAVRLRDLLSSGEVAHSNDDSEIPLYAEFSYAITPPH